MSNVRNWANHISASICVCDCTRVRVCMRVYVMRKWLVRNRNMVTHSADSLCKLSWNFLSFALGVAQWATFRIYTVKGTKIPPNFKIKCRKSDQGYDI